MRRKTGGWIAAVAVVAAAALTSGCAALVVGGAAGAGGAAYFGGEWKVTEDATIDKAWAAARAASDELQWTITDSFKDGLEAKLSAQSGAGRTVVIRLARVSDHSTTIRIRVGTFGNESISRQLAERIHARL